MARIAVGKGCRGPRRMTGLNEATVDAVKKWTFEPAEDRNGNPVSALVVIPVDFHF